MNQEPQVLAQHEEMLPVEEPPFFDRTLLLQPPEVRQEYFEQHCLIEHPRLLEALDAILEAICAPGKEVLTRRPGTMVLVIGPARIGKTTLIHLLEERLLAYAAARMRTDPHFIPFASITAPEAGSGRFDWIDFYRPVLRQLGNPFVDSPTQLIRARQMQEATEAAYLERKPLAIIVDEAHHLAEATRGSRLQIQLNHLKNFENTTGVSHILVGTYEMRPFRKVNPHYCQNVLEKDGLIMPEVALAFAQVTYMLLNRIWLSHLLRTGVQFLENGGSSFMLELMQEGVQPVRRKQVPQQTQLISNVSDMSCGMSKVENPYHIRAMVLHHRLHPLCSVLHCHDHLCPIHCAPSDLTTGLITKPSHLRQLCKVGKTLRKHLVSFLLDTVCAFHLSHCQQFDFRPLSMHERNKGSISTHHHALARLFFRTRGQRISLLLLHRETVSSHALGLSADRSSTDVDAEQLLQMLGDLGKRQACL